MATVLSVICPVHNEARCVPLFYQRLMAALEPLSDTIEVELIFMNNRSTDRTADEVRHLRERDPRVQLLTLSKNVGYQASVQTGLREAAGDAIVVIDVDCEDPPELIPRFVEEWRRGSDLVYGERKNRPEPHWLTWMRRGFYRLNRLLADSDIVLDMAEFCLMSAAVRDAALNNRSTFPFVRAELAAVGFARKAIPYDRGSRIAGESHYNLVRMTMFAIGGILSSTTFPLRASLYALALLFPVNVAWLVARTRGTTTGFDAIVVLDLLYLCTFVAFVSLYLARTYRNGVGRPVGIIDWDASAADKAANLRRPRELARTERSRYRR